MRVCRNPDCGLRYPVHAGQRSERCPVCLGMTDVVLERALVRESSTFIRPQEHGSGLSVLLDNIRSAWNVGSILRTAEGFGFSHAYLCGITPNPANPAVRKTSLGSEDAVHWSINKNALHLVNELQKEGAYILALETADDAVPIDRLKMAEIDRRPVILVVGSEVTGVDPGILQTANRVAYLPMRGKKRSFNVAVAFGAAAWSLSRRVQTP